MVEWVNDVKLKKRILEAETLVAIAFLQYDSIPSNYFVPKYAAAAKELAGNLEFYRINPTENPQIAEDLGVDAVPTTLVFRDGVMIARYEGPYSKEALCERITHLLGPDKQ